MWNSRVEKISDIRPLSSPVFDSECILVCKTKDRHKNHPARGLFWAKKTVWQDLGKSEDCLAFAMKSRAKCIAFESKSAQY